MRPPFLKWRQNVCPGSKLLNAVIFSTCTKFDMFKWRYLENDRRYSNWVKGFKLLVPQLTRKSKNVNTCIYTLKLAVTVCSNYNKMDLFEVVSVENTRPVELSLSTHYAYISDVFSMHVLKKLIELSNEVCKWKTVQ